MPRVTAILSISLPREMARRIELACRAEHRTRSELIREALRAYLRAAELQALQERSLRLPDSRPEGAAPARPAGKPRNTRDRARSRS